MAKIPLQKIQMGILYNFLLYNYKSDASNRIPKSRKQVHDFVFPVQQKPALPFLFGYHH